MKNKFGYIALAINFFLVLINWNFMPGISRISNLIGFGTIINPIIVAFTIYLIVMSFKKRESKFILALSIFFIILNLNQFFFGGMGFFVIILLIGALTGLGPDSVF